MIWLPACPQCFVPLRIALDEERSPWLECGECHSVFASPLEVVIYTQDDYEPRYNE